MLSHRFVAFSMFVLQRLRSVGKQRDTKWVCCLKHVHFKMWINVPLLQGSRCSNAMMQSSNAPVPKSTEENRFNKRSLS